MAMSVTYTTILGQIVHEMRSAVERFYVPDPLGNTAALVDTTGAVKDTWTYWPYGEIQNHTGSSTTALTFLGTIGYFGDFLNTLYVRARHLRADLTRWITVDPIWPNEAQYGYVGGNPTIWTDASGLGACSFQSRPKPKPTLPPRLPRKNCKAERAKCDSDCKDQLADCLEYIGTDSALCALACLLVGTPPGVALCVLLLCGPAAAADVRDCTKQNNDCTYICALGELACEIYNRIWGGRRPKVVSHKLPVH